MVDKRIKRPKVYLSKNISLDGLLELFRAIGREVSGRVVASVQTEKRGDGMVQQFLSELGIDMFDDGNGGDTGIPVGFYGHLQGENFIKAGFLSYNSFVVVSKFMRECGSFGGVVDNLSLGFASVGGNTWIRSAGFTKDKDVMWSHAENDYRFAESKVEAAKSVSDYFGRANFIFINLIYNSTGEVAGIVGGVDAVAVDKASFELMKKCEYKNINAFTDEDDENEFLHALYYAEKVGLGEQDYNLLEI